MLENILIVLLLCLFALTLFTWLRFFAWYSSLLSAANTKAAQHQKRTFLGTGGLFGLYKLATERGRSSQWFGFGKALFWAAITFVATMVVAGLLMVPNETDCGIAQEVFQDSILSRFECLTRFIEEN